MTRTTLTSEDIIEQCLPAVRSIAYRMYAIARDHNDRALDVDDFVQEGLLAIVERLSRPAPDVRNVVAFSIKIAHDGMYGLLRRCAPKYTMSLNVPLSQDSPVTLAEILPAPARQPGGQEGQARTQMLYSSLRRLPLHQQRAVRTSFSLVDFTPHANKRRRIKNPSSKQEAVYSRL